MKPDWDELPKWAKFIAMDESGRWCWFDKEPIRYGSFWVPPADGKHCDCAKNKHWTTTMEKRPVKKNKQSEKTC